MGSDQHFFVSQRRDIGERLAGAWRAFHNGASRMLNFYTGAVLTKLIAVGYTVGLFEASRIRRGRNYMFVCRH